MLTIRAAGCTDRGRVRSENQDRWLADAARGLYLVTDGMGGAFAGALAAQLVVTSLPVLLEAALPAEADLTAASDGVRAALVTLSEQMRQASVKQFGRAGMGATVVMALIRQDQALIAHLGDSRAYLLRSGQFTCLTRDHSLAQLLLEAGEITAEEAKQHPGRAQLTRYVGMSREVLPEVHALRLAPGDRLLLCSDGVWKPLAQETLRAELQADEPPRSLCQRLVGQANAAGGDDNSTTLVVTCQARWRVAAARRAPRQARASGDCS
jgi:serine/threonine protein phosphatase PrpC